jgi:hypothetical protein
MEVDARCPLSATVGVILKDLDERYPFGITFDDFICSSRENPELLGEIYEGDDREIPAIHLRRSYEGTTFDIGVFFFDSDRKLFLSKTNFYYQGCIYYILRTPLGMCVKKC